MSGDIFFSLILTRTFLPVCLLLCRAAAFTEAKGQHPSVPCFCPEPQREDNVHTNTHRVPSYTLFDPPLHPKLLTPSHTHTPSPSFALWGVELIEWELETMHVLSKDSRALTSTLKHLVTSCWVRTENSTIGLLVNCYFWTHCFVGFISVIWGGRAEIVIVSGWSVQTSVVCFATVSVSDCTINKS